MSQALNSDGELSGRTAVVTGAASGIGRALVELLFAKGASVHAVDVNEEGLEGLSKGIRPHRLDIRDLRSFGAVVEAVAAESRSIDFFFNNAGVTQLGLAQHIPFERWKWLLDINLMGVINGIQCVYPVMIRQGHGHIVNTASIAGHTGYATAAAYTASKAAVLELTRSLRAEAEAYGVLVSAACPGYVSSGIFTQDRIVGADRGAVIDDLPVRMISPEQAAAAILRGVMKKRGMIVFPFSARFLWQLSSWAPVLVKPFHRRFLRVFQNERD